MTLPTVVSAERPHLPMVRIEKDYVFDTPDGKRSLLDLFDGRRQLIVYHFMFDPSWDEGCPGCSLLVDNIGHLSHLHARNTSLTIVSRAPMVKIEAYRERMGWTVPWVSSHGTDFNYDFHSTLDPSVAPPEYNFAPATDGGRPVHVLAAPPRRVRRLGILRERPLSWKGEC